MIPRTKLSYDITYSHLRPSGLSSESYIRSTIYYHRTWSHYRHLHHSSPTDPYYLRECQPTPHLPSSSLHYGSKPRIRRPSDFNVNDSTHFDNSPYPKPIPNFQTKIYTIHTPRIIRIYTSTNHSSTYIHRH